MEEQFNLEGNADSWNRALSEAEMSLLKFVRANVDAAQKINQFSKEMSSSHSKMAIAITESLKSAKKSITDIDIALGAVAKSTANNVNLVSNLYEGMANRISASLGKAAQDIDISLGALPKKAIADTSLIGNVYAGMANKISSSVGRATRDIDALLGATKAKLAGFQLSSGSKGGGRTSGGGDIDALLGVPAKAGSGYSLASGTASKYIGSGSSSFDLTYGAMQKEEVKNAERVLSLQERIHAAIRKNKEEVDRYNQSSQHVLFTWQSLTRLLTIQLIHQAVTQVVYGLVNATKYAIELSSHLAEIQTISQDTSHNVESQARWLKESIVLSNKYGFNLSDQVEAGYQLLSDQVIKTSSDFASFGDVVNRFAITAQTDVANAAQLMSASLNSFQLTTADAEHVAASFFKTIEIGRVRAEEMSQSYGQISILASQLGLDLDQLNAMIAVTTIRGIKFAETSTQIRGLLTKLIKPTKEMAELYRQLGVDSGEAAIKQFGFVGVLQLLQRQTKGTASEVAELFNNIRGMNVAQLLLGSGTDTYEKALDKIQNATDYYRRAQDYALNSTGTKAKQAIAEVANTFTQQGINLLETVRLVTNDFTYLVKIFNVAAAAIKSALIPAITALGTALGILSYSSLTNPIIGISALASVIIGEVLYAKDAAKRSYDELDAAARKAGESITKTYDTVLATFNQTVKQAQDLADKEYQRYNVENALINQLLEARVKNVKENQKETLEALRNIAERAIDDIKEALSTEKNGLTETRNRIRELQKDMLSGKKKAASQLFDWELEGKNAGQKYAAIQQKLRQLDNERRKAAIQGNREEFEAVTEEMTGLLKKQRDLLTDIYKIDSGNQRSRSGNHHRKRIFPDEVALVERRNQLEQQYRSFTQDTLARQEQMLQLEAKREEIQRRRVFLLSQEEDNLKAAKDNLSDLKDKAEPSDATKELQKRIAVATAQMGTAKDPSQFLNAVNSLSVARRELANTEISDIFTNYQHKTEAIYNELMAINKAQPLIEQVFAEKIATARTPLERQDFIEEAMKQRKSYETNYKEIIDALKDYEIAANAEVAQRRLKAAAEEVSFRINSYNQQIDLLEQRTKSDIETVKTAKTIGEVIKAEVSKAVYPDGKKDYSGATAESYRSAQLLNTPIGKLLAADKTGGVKEAQARSRKSFDFLEAFIQESEAFSTGEMTADKVKSMYASLNNLIGMFKDPSQIAQGSPESDVYNKIIAQRDSFKGMITNGIVDPAKMSAYIKKLEEDKISLIKAQGSPQERLTQATLGLTSSMDALRTDLVQAMTELGLAKKGTQAAALPPPGSYASGGSVSWNRDGVDPSDTIPAWLSPGEFVVNARSAKQWQDLLYVLNNNGTPLQAVHAMRKSANLPHLYDYRSSYSIGRQQALDTYGIGQSLGREQDVVLELMRTRKAAWHSYATGGPVRSQLLPMQGTAQRANTAGITMDNQFTINAGNNSPQVVASEIWNTIRRGVHRGELAPL